MDASQRQAADTIVRVMGGETLARALEASGAEATPARGFVQELAYGTLRHWGTLEAIVGALITTVNTPVDVPKTPLSSITSTSATTAATPQSTIGGVNPVIVVSLVTFAVTDARSEEPPANG